MAAIAEVQTVNITVNDIEVAVPKGELIVEAVKRVGLEIPIFCYHPRMKPVGMCRMCLVEVGMKQPDGTVRKMPKPQAACTLPASEGLVIYTDTENVHKDRQGVLEFLLINHPLDCPICDKGGECPLQNNTLYYGPSTSRYVEVKRHAAKAYPLSKYVTLDLERCIQCGRCVRFTEEISGDAELAFRFRGNAMQPSTFGLLDFTSKFSGNVIEICPVGALTNATYRFRARPWDLQTKEGICTGCSNGCNVWVDYRNGGVVRINGRTNEAINEEWTCDKGKFGSSWFGGGNRVTSPLSRVGSQLDKVSWSDAYANIVTELKGVSANEVAVLASSAFSNEDLYLLNKLFREVIGTNNIDHRFTKTLPTAADRIEVKLGSKKSPSTIASFESQKAVMVFGTSLADDEPILFLRVRKAWSNNGAKVIVATDSATDVDTFANVVLRYKTGTAATLAAGLALAAGVKGADARFTAAYVAEQTGVSAELIAEAGKILAEDQASIVTTTSIYNEEGAQTAVDTLASIAVGTNGRFDHFGLEANTEGADRLGILPDVLPGGSAAKQAGLNTHQILEACAKGEIKFLWLAGVDLFNTGLDRTLVEAALENVSFLVVQTASQSESVPFASVVLPLAPSVERDGSYTNIEGRVQWQGAVLPAKGEAKPAWAAFADLSMRLQPGMPVFNAKNAFEILTKEVSGFNTTFEALVGEGAVL